MKRPCKSGLEVGEFAKVFCKELKMRNGCLTLFLDLIPYLLNVFINILNLIFTFILPFLLLSLYLL